MNGAADIEYDGSIWLADGVAKRSRTGVVQVCHVIDFASVTARGQRSKTFCTGKCHERRICRGNGCHKHGESQDDYWKHDPLHFTVQTRPANFIAASVREWTCSFS